MSDITITFLGQVTTLIKSDKSSFLIDPYLSNSVEIKEDPTIKRITPILRDPSTFTDIDFVLLTHDHLDHCDPDTLLPISKASPDCIFIGPLPVINILKKNGLAPEKLQLIRSETIQCKDAQITPVPSAHPVVRPLNGGGWMATGYLIQFADTLLYHPGDTAVSGEIVEYINNMELDIDIGLIPVNEINYYRNNENIIGNMSIREAYRFSEDIGIRHLIPTHWDMFQKNQVFPEEIILLYDKLNPPFKLSLLYPGESYVS